MRTTLLEVTVVIACHSELRWNGISAAIDSVLEQELPPVALIVAVDHNPGLARRLEDEYPGLIVVRNDGPRGASGNRNAGAAASRSPITAFLDDDEVAERGWLLNLVRPFSDSKVIGSGGRYIPAWSTREPFWFPDEFAWVVGAHHGAMPKIDSEVRNVWAGNMAVRTETFRSVSGFRTDFGKIGDRSQPEDTDLCIRMSQATGGIWVYVPNARIHHEVPAARSNFRFFVQRCYSEGHGKIALSRALSESQKVKLDDEAEYMRRTVPLGFFAHLGRGVQSFSRAVAMACGVAAAGFGAFVAVVSHRLKRS